MMRILIILLLFVSRVQGQIINASAPYKPPQLLLDQYGGAAAAYSLRKLNSSYTGACIRVRRDSTGQAESDIGFDNNGYIDTVALKNFVRNNSGYIVTWYNQADSSGVFGVRNATQSVQSNQPRIMLNGTIDRANSKPAIQFNSHLLQVTLSGISSVTKLQTYCVITPTVAATADVSTEILWGIDGGGSSSSSGNRGISWGASTGLLTGEKFGMYFSNNGINYGRLGSSTYSRAANTMVLHVTVNSNTLSGWYVNGETATRSFNRSINMDQTTNASPSNSNLQTSNFWIKSIQGSTNTVEQKYSELIIYYDTYTGYLSGVQSNINSFYAIY